MACTNAGIIKAGLILATMDFGAVLVFPLNPGEGIPTPAESCWREFTIPLNLYLQVIQATTKRPKRRGIKSILREEGGGDLRGYRTL